jgi:hypothetical protein
MTAPIWLQSRKPEWPEKEPLQFQTDIKLVVFGHGHPSQRLFGASDGCPSEQGENAAPVLEADGNYQKFHIPQENFTSLSQKSSALSSSQISSTIN